MIKVVKFTAPLAHASENQLLRRAKYLYAKADELSALLTEENAEDFIEGAKQYSAIVDEVKEILNELEKFDDKN